MRILFVGRVVVLRAVQEWWGSGTEDSILKTGRTLEMRLAFGEVSSQLSHRLPDACALFSVVVQCGLESDYYKRRIL